MPTPQPNRPALAAALFLALPAAAGARDVDFVEEVLPILQGRCFECHGPDKQKGDLRLDQRAGLFEGDEGFIPVVPGKPESSELYVRITLPPDDLDIMPAKGDVLGPDEIETIRLWIAEGAPWSEPPPPEGAPAADPADSLELPPLSAEEQAAEAAALAALAEREVHAMRVARGLQALDVNFSLRRDDVGDAEAALLAGLEPSLVWLNFSGTALTDAGLDPVARCRELRKLNLSKTAVTDAGLEQLAGLDKLLYLNLYGTGVGDAGLEHLHGLKRLRKLYLWQTPVTDAGVARLQAALPELAIDRGLALAQPAAAAPAEEPAGPVNDTCPLSGQAIDPAFHSTVDDQRIAFCCGDCKAKFDADPAAFLAKVAGFVPAPEPEPEPDSAGPINAACPISGQPVDPAASSVVDGQRIAFCCGDCKAKFDACLLYTSPSPRDGLLSRMPSSA